MDDAASERAPEEPGRRGIPLFKVAGIRIRLDYSWFLIFLLVFVALSVGYFPSTAPEAGVLSHWIAGLVSALLFFASIVAHELAHSWVAIRAGIHVPEITLFLFGGASRMAQEPMSPQIELRVAIVGPLMSFLLAIIFLFLSSAGEAWPWMLPTIFAYLGWINLALGIFNLLPGYPLDGGRVLRALVWWKTGSLRRGTRVASDAGKTFGIALVVLGAIQILMGGLLGGVWMILIGMFLRGLARQGYEDVLVRNALANVDVERVMVSGERLVTVPPELSLRDLVDDYFLGAGHQSYPVVEDGRPAGLITLDEVRRFDKAAWPETSVREAMIPRDGRIEIEPDASLLDALQRLSGGKLRRLLVMEGDELKGLLSASSITRFAEVRSITRGEA